MNSVCLCVLLLNLLFECGHSDSPCPDIFNFFTNGNDVFGKITLQPVETVSSLEIRLNYTVQADLDDFLGRIDSPDDVLDKYNRGEAVSYRVYFPVISPRPKVTAIAVNGDTICIGPGDKPIPNQVISRPSLQVTNSNGVGGGLPGYTRFQHQPQLLPTSVNNHNDADVFSHYIKAFRDSSPFKNYSPLVTQWSTTPRSTPTTTTTAPTTTTTTAPTTTTTAPTTTTTAPTTTTTAPTTTTSTTPLLQPVRRTSRPEYHFSEECGVVAGSNEFSPLINNGLSYERGEIPWLVAIYKTVKTSLQFICGGTLVSDRHVVTAAHCMQGPRVRLPETNVVVRVGLHDLNDWSDDIAVTSKLLAATIHEFYNSSTLRNDLMILTLNKRILFTDFIRPACLWSGNNELSLVVGATGVVAGWGDDELDEPQMLRVPIVSTKECRASATGFHKLTSYNTLCAGSRDGNGPCKGDSGGGLYLLNGGRWRLRGVVSLSLQNGNRASACNLNEYVVYTDTAQFLPWIRNVLSQKYFD